MSMKMVWIGVGLILACYSSKAQDTLAGYASTVTGESMNYTSYSPLATESILTRTNTGKMVMQWMTDPVPLDYKGDTVYFSWVGANAFGTLFDDANFDLSVNGKYALTIHITKNAPSPDWYFNNGKGISIRFIKKAYDVSNDVSGDVILGIAKNQLSGAKPLWLTITGQNQNHADWLMVFKYKVSNQFTVEALPLLQRSPKGDTLRLLKLSGDFKGKGGSLSAVVWKMKPKSNLAYLNTAPELLVRESFTLHPGYNSFLWGIPYHTGMPAIIVRMAVDGSTPPATNPNANGWKAVDENWNVISDNGPKGLTMPADTLALSTLQPLELDLVSHSHTDIGYSHLQQKVASIQIDNIRKAIDLINQTKDYPEAAQFKWNIESLWAVENFLDSADANQINAFAQALATGRLTLQAFYANELTGLLDGEELVWLTAYARKLEERFHVSIRSAMITDVPGYTWSTIQGLSQAGIKYFSIGPNAGDRIGGVLKTWGDKPFYWQVPGSNEKVLTDVAGSSYSWFHGMTGSGNPDLLTKRLVAYTNKLNQEAYPYQYALLRYNIVSDNAPLDTGISNFVKNWNETYLYPKLVLSTPEQTLSAIERDYSAKIPVLKGDMSPYWEDGAASTGMELGWNRALRSSLEQSEVLDAILNRHSALHTESLYKTWRGVVMFDEHTWGAWSSVSDPDNPFSVAQWAFKRAFLSQADSLHTLERQAILHPWADHSGEYQLINTHSWETDATINLGTTSPNRIFTGSDGKPLIQQQLSNGDRIAYISSMPGLAGKTVRVAPGNAAGVRGTGAAGADAARINGYTIDNKWLTLRIDSSTGAISSLVYKSNNQDIVQPGSFAFNQYEYVPGRDPANAQTAKVTNMQVTDNGPLLTKVVLHCDAPGTKDLVISYELNNNNGNLTITDSLDKLKVREKEAVHFAFPFNIPGSALNADNGAFPYAPFTDTLAGGNRDFGYIGKWMDWSGADWGLTFVSPQTPIMEWGEMRSELIPANSSVSKWKTSFSPTQTLFSYALNNYWHTNYKADQEGSVCFSYTLIPHGPKDLVAAYKSAEEIIAPPVILQSAKRHLETPFIKLSNNQAVVNIIQPLATPGNYWIRVYNPSDKPVHTNLSAGTLKIFRSSMHQEKGTAVSPGGLDLEPFGNVDLLLISGLNK